MSLGSRSKCYGGGQETCGHVSCLFWPSPGDLKKGYRAFHYHPLGYALTRVFEGSFRMKKCDLRGNLEGQGKYRGWVHDTYNPGP